MKHQKQQEEVQTLQQAIQDVVNLALQTKQKPNKRYNVVGEAHKRASTI
jgi:hypothetical protein